MSLYNSPKEHKLRKPRTGFEKIKQQQWDDLNSPKEEMEMKPLIELSEEARLRIKKKRRRLILLQVLVFTLILIPVTIAAVSFFYKKVETTHQNLAPHLYQPIPPPYSERLYTHWKDGYTAYANQDYEKAIANFDKLYKGNSKVSFGITGLILSHQELCNQGDEDSCYSFESIFSHYKHYYTLRNQDDETILKEMRTFTKEQIEKALSQ